MNGQLINWMFDLWLASLPRHFGKYWQWEQPGNEANVPLLQDARLAPGLVSRVRVWPARLPRFV